MNPTASWDLPTEPLTIITAEQIEAALPAA